MLEVDLVFPDHIYRRRQISCAHHHVPQLCRQRIADDAGGLARRGRACREGLLGGDDAPPVFGEAAFDTLDKLVVQLGELLSISLH